MSAFKGTDKEFQLGRPSSRLSECSWPQRNTDDDDDDGQDSYSQVFHCFCAINQCPKGTGSRGTHQGWPVSRTDAPHAVALSKDMYRESVRLLIRIWVKEHSFSRAPWKGQMECYIRPGCGLGVGDHSHCMQRLWMK